jgi:hypothetical protein
MFPGPPQVDRPAVAADHRAWFADAVGGDQGAVHADVLVPGQMRIRPGTRR